MNSDRPSELLPNHKSRNLPGSSQLECRSLYIGMLNMLRATCYMLRSFQVYATGRVSRTENTEDSGRRTGTERSPPGPSVIGHGWMIQGALLVSGCSCNTACRLPSPPPSGERPGLFCWTSTLIQTRTRPRRRPLSYISTRADEGAGARTEGQQLARSLSSRRPAQRLEKTLVVDGRKKGEGGRRALERTSRRLRPLAA